MSTSIKTSAILAAAATWLRNRIGGHVSWALAGDALINAAQSLCGNDTDRRKAEQVLLKTLRVRDLASYRPQSVADIVSAFVDAEVDAAAVEKAEEDKAAEEPDGARYATHWFPCVTLSNGGTLSVTVNPPAPEPASHPGLLREILRKGSVLQGKTPDGKSVELRYDPESATRSGLTVPASWDVNTLNAQGVKAYECFVVYAGDDGFWPKCDDVTAFRKAREHFIKLTAKPAKAWHNGCCPGPNCTSAPNCAF